MKALLTLNTLLCVVALAPAYGIFTGGVILGMATPGDYGVLIILMSLAAPVVPLVSVIGSWLAYRWDSETGTFGFIALPWAYAVVFFLVVGVNPFG